MHDERQRRLKSCRLIVDSILLRQLSFIILMIAVGHSSSAVNCSSTAKGALVNALLSVRALCYADVQLHSS